MAFCLMPVIKALGTQRLERQGKASFSYIASSRVTWAYFRLSQKLKINKKEFIVFCGNL